MSNGEEFDRDSVIVSDKWRFANVPTTVGGLNSSILLGLPPLIPAAWMGTVKLTLFVWIAYIAFVYYLNTKWKITPYEWVLMMNTRFLKGNRWRVR
ncbi:hypothetical protein [uncultured Tateyamaria sp.]|uniref:hypothetical protein n=1 Tax=uncultured Tateyamaria sp. TaxID=455651 RepID=UPI002611F0E7|nr:hypothetical protein [uncultured Tateyamaria sp.]